MNGKLFFMAGVCTLGLLGGASFGVSQYEIVSVGFGLPHSGDPAYNGSANAVNDSGTVVVNDGYGAYTWSEQAGLNLLSMSSASAINNSGQVTGFLGGAANLFTPGEGTRSLGMYNGHNTEPLALNDAGQVVGYAGIFFPADAWLWTDTNGFVDLGDLSSVPGVGSVAKDINEGAAVVGSAQVDSGDWHAFLWTPSAGMRDLGTPDGVQHSYGRGINSRTEVVGETLANSFGPWGGFYWSEATGMVVLPLVASDISDEGLIVGNQANGQGGWSASVWSGSHGLSALEVPPYATSSRATAISDNGDFIAGGLDRPDVFGQGVMLPILWKRVPVPVVPGDMNGDGNVDNLDTTPFVMTLTASEAAFEAVFPEGEYWAADVNEDGNVDNLDISPFVDLLAGGGQVVPEPVTLSLLALGGLAMIRGRRGRQKGMFSSNPS